MHRYRLLYKFIPKPEGVLKSEIPDEHGATDAVVFGSIIYPEDGSASYCVVTKDGRTGEELSPDDIFSFWTILARRLAETLPPGGRRELCESVFEVIRGGGRC